VSECISDQTFDIYFWTAFPVSSVKQHVDKIFAALGSSKTLLLHANFSESYLPQAIIMSLVFKTIHVCWARPGWPRL